MESIRLNFIKDKLKNSFPFKRLLEEIKGPLSTENTGSAVTGLAGSSLSLLVSQIQSSTDRPLLVITSTAEEAQEIYEDCLFLVGEDKAGLYPSRQILPYDFKAPVGEIMGQRIASLLKLSENNQPITILPVRAALEPSISKEYLSSSRLNLEVGQEHELDDLIKRLIVSGFKRVPLVEEVGDFSLRGGLIDLFTPACSAPVRIDFFGDEIESMRLFDVATQRTFEKIDRLTILPRREIPISQESLENHLEKLPEEDADYIRQRYLNDPELPGLEWLSLLFKIKQGSFLEFIPKDAIIYFLGKGAVEAEIDNVLLEADNLFKRQSNQNIKLPPPETYYLKKKHFLETLNGYTHIDHLLFKGGKDNLIDFGCRPHPSFASRLDLLGQTLSEYNSLEIKYFIATDTEGQADRLRELIMEKGGVSFEPNIEVANLKGGFVSSQGQYAILTDHQIFNRHHRRLRKKKFKEGIAIVDYTSLTKGDYVVHTEYGVARYAGLETLQVDNRKRDCLNLEYANKDKLFVPIEEFNRVSKYSGKDGAPSLTSLGGTGWERLKKKTKKAITDMAEELLKLYAKRKTVTGHSFGEDTVWLKQLEASFIYEETPDQLKAIQDVKRDMANEKPMDRLICGDVGYGKTEVAIRAAFKAIDSGKQVAILVPTTILAQQHFQTFSERLAEFPVKIDLLSRFRNKKQQTETLENLANGKVDLLIGTHRLLSKDVIFSDLGLLIIDEEHRFGVSHKEKLRMMREAVDTLSMTATPIPRTLHLSLISARDMSLINTSPKDRLPIITEITEFEESKIATIILREIDRGGQVYFVHNRVQTIDAMYQQLKKILPQVNIAVAHGQMNVKNLETVMMDFMEQKYQMLLCTSIIESGLDIPTANTIIINRADRFGLAQLYQIRGRVGRSSKRAYAYLLSPPMRNLKPEAVKRLRALEVHSDLGSGFALAMRDLEIRGAGTILGTKQSGYMEEIGFEMYNKLLEETIAEIKGEEKRVVVEARLEIDFETYLDNEYINERQHKVDIYRRLADSKNIDEVENLREEIIDRFGKMPVSGLNLFDAAGIKVSASNREIEKVTMRNGKVNIFYPKNYQLKRDEVESFRKSTAAPMEFSLIGRAQIIIDLGQVKSDDRLKHLRSILI